MAELVARPVRPRRRSAVLVQPYLKDATYAVLVRELKTTLPPSTSSARKGATVVSFLDKRTHGGRHFGTIRYHNGVHLSERVHKEPPQRPRSRLSRVTYVIRSDLALRASDCTKTTRRGEPSSVFTTGGGQRSTERIWIRFG